MKTVARNLFVSITLYFFILMFGMFVIFVVQYQYHSDLKVETEKYATEWSETGKIIEEEHIRGCVYFMENEHATPIQLFTDDNASVYQDFIPEFIEHHYSSQAFYQLTLRLNPLNFFAISSFPVYTNGVYAGSIYAAHAISYLPSVVNTFVLFYTFIYYILSMHVYFIHKINRRITSIYRKYIANISHELKSPIASIHAITETLNAGLVTDEETLLRYYGIIDRESHRLEQSVLDIIELSKIQDQRIDVSKERTPVSDIIGPIGKRYEDFCEDVGIHFSINSSVSKLPDLYTNTDRIVQLLQILLDNAAKFTSEGGSISIHAEYDDRQAIFHISDTGCGMDEETISHIFERFYRGNNTGEYTGSGLGLSIAKEIVNALDEKIWATSELGVGTDFYFTVSRKKKRWKLQL